MALLKFGQRAVTRGVGRHLYERLRIRLQSWQAAASRDPHARNLRGTRPLRLTLRRRGKTREVEPVRFTDYGIATHPDLIGNLRA